MLRIILRSFSLFAVGTFLFQSLSFAKTCEEVLANKDTAEIQSLKQLLEQMDSQRKSPPILRVGEGITDTQAIKTIREHLHEIGTLMDQSASQGNPIIIVHFLVGNTIYFITKIGNQGNEYAVRHEPHLVDPERKVEARNIRMNTTHMDQAVSKRSFVKEKRLKEFLAQIPSVHLKKIQAATLFDANISSMPLYVIFRDAKVSGKGNVTTTHREIIDVTYPRYYRISNTGIHHVLSKHRITVTNLDHLFEQWDGKAYPEMDLTYDNGVSDYRMFNQVFWFLGRNEQGQLVRVVFALIEGQPLPYLVTAYQVDASTLQKLNRTMERSAPRIVFEN